MANFYHVYIKPGAGISTKQVEAKMNLALDWIRYGGGHNYIVYSSSDKDKLYGRLESLIKPGGSLFIVGIDISDRQGLMSKSFWSWLKKDRSKKQNKA